MSGSSTFFVFVWLVQSGPSKIFWPVHLCKKCFLARPYMRPPVLNVSVRTNVYCMFQGRKTDEILFSLGPAFKKIVLYRQISL